MIKSFSKNENVKIDHSFFQEIMNLHQPINRGCCNGVNFVIEKNRMSYLFQSYITSAKEIIIKKELTDGIWNSAALRLTFTSIYFFLTSTTNK